MLRCHVKGYTRRSFLLCSIHIDCRDLAPLFFQHLVSHTFRPLYISSWLTRGLGNKCFRDTISEPLIPSRPDELFLV
jgi:hypothetical protein